MPIYTLPVNSFNNVRTGWSRVGKEPYLDKAGDGNYIYTSKDGDEIGNFGFENLPYGNIGRVESCDLYLYCMQEDVDDMIRIFVWDGSYWNWAGTVTPSTGSYGFEVVDVLGYLNTPAKINGALMYLFCDIVGRPLNVYADYASLRANVSLTELDHIRTEVHVRRLTRLLKKVGL